MKVAFPSREFDDAVAAICHGTASDEQMRALNELLRADKAAMDEYLIQVELHSRLASAPDLFSAPASDLDLGLAEENSKIVPLRPPARSRTNGAIWAASIAAVFIIVAIFAFMWLRDSGSRAPTSRAVAVLTQSLSTKWDKSGKAHMVGEALEPGWVRLDAGLIQIAFYSGARVVIEGPAQVRLVSSKEVECPRGKLIANVPPQAQGFRIRTPETEVVDLGTEFGLEVKEAAAEVHVFKGRVQYGTKIPNNSLVAGEAALVDLDGRSQQRPANRAAFSALYDLQQRWEGMLVLCYERWMSAGLRWNYDPSLVVRFDLEDVQPSDWRLHNVAEYGKQVADASIVGCQISEGRWPGKRSLEFRSMSDRVRFVVPGEYRALTLTAWVNVRGLDREFNSIFMCDGFAPGSIHWQIQNSGKLDLRIKGQDTKPFQAAVSPEVVTFDKFGRWLHLAVVIDGDRRQIVHYVNGLPVSRHKLEPAPPFRLGAAELGNWNPGAQPKDNPFLIRQFSGAMDEFALYDRALKESEIQALYFTGKPEPDFTSDRDH